LFLPFSGNVFAATITNEASKITIQDSTYQMDIELNQFKYSFSHDNSTIAPHHSTSGLTLNGSNALSSTYNADISSTTELNFSVTFEDQSTATVKIFP